jgi:hypothetical protein
MMKSQFSLKPKGQGFSYKHPYPELYDQVVLPLGCHLPELTKFTSQDGTSMMEHISQYLTQLGEASIEEAF